MKQFSDFTQLVSDIAFDPKFYNRNYVEEVARRLYQDVDSIEELQELTEEEFWDYFKGSEITEENCREEFEHTTMPSSCLNEIEQNLFQEYFYEICDIDESESPFPWGCPWLHGSNPKLEGSSIKEMAKNYYEEYRDEIDELLEAEDEDE